MFFNYRAVMIPECRIFIFIFSIIRYNNDKDFFSALPNNSESLLNILVSDSFVVVVDSNILYRGSVLAFLAAAAILRSSSYLILYNRYYSTLYF